jgi:hypothetical protein
MHRQNVPDLIILPTVMAIEQSRIMMIVNEQKGRIIYWSGFCYFGWNFAVKQTFDIA